jgi:predicted ribosomally synthesized peptide with SipW-like signal peptide
MPGNAKKGPLMAISNKTKAIAAAAILAGSIGLVSMGSSALFTDTVTAQASVKAGTAKLRIQADGWTVGDGGHTATLNHVEFLDSSTKTITTSIINVFNDGDVDLSVNPQVAGSGELGLQVSLERVGGTGDGRPDLAAGNYVQYKVIIKATNLGNEVSGKTEKVTFSLDGSA